MRTGVFGAVVLLGSLGLAVSAGTRAAHYAHQRERLEELQELLRAGREQSDHQAVMGRELARLPDDWAPSDAEVDAGLAAALAEVPQAPAAACLADPAGASVDEAAAALAACYAAGDLPRAEALLAARPDVVACDALPTGALAYAVFERREVEPQGALRVVVEREEAAGPLAVVFPPGSYGQPRSEETLPGCGPSQDLAFLRAPALVLGPGQRRAEVIVPVACAAFSKSSPRAGSVHHVRRFPHDSAVGRLLVSLCREDRPADEAEAQLAVWVAANDLHREEFLPRAYMVATFGQGQTITPRDIRGAADLLIKAGLDPRGASMYQGAPGLTPRPRLLAPQQAPQPPPVPAAPAPAPGAAKPLDA